MGAGLHGSAGTLAEATGDAHPGLAAERAARVDTLVAAMTLEEKAAQLVGLWVGADASGGGVAPHQADMTGSVPAWSDVIAHGLGQLTRPFGTAPVAPVLAARSLAASQREIVAASRFGIPAQVHEECLTGFAAWQATTYPTPLAWGATFDPDLVEEMAVRIGTSMRAAGVHQGLAPVLDVTRDYRWGRTEETIAEDPYLVGTVGAAYVRGLESTGVVATLKHFAGYSASRAGRNLAPVSMGPTELADVILPPFETALRHGGARAVMHSYAEIDGVPAAADPWLLTDLLRDRWGFEGIVVADYYGIAFLQTLHGVAGSRAEAAGLALSAGVDVELPSLDAYGAPLVAAVCAGDVDEALVDRALHRVLTQKAALGLLDPGWTPEPADVEQLVLDDAAGQDVALRLARESLVLVANDGVLPLASGARVAVVGPLADAADAMLGCYTFPAHVGSHHPDVPRGIDVPGVATELRRLHGEVTTARGCDVDTDDRTGFAEAVEVARDADVVVVAVGDRAGLFGRGTSGEGCDVTDLRLPGVQEELVDAVLATGTPVVVLLLTGRPYAVGGFADRAAALVQAFFPGQRGGQAVAEVLTGAVPPSGRLPVSLPRHASGQPGTYLTQPLGARSGVSNIDPTPLHPFGHGLAYTSFAWADARALDGDVWPVDGTTRVAVDVTNTGDRPGTEVVQVYLHDPVASVVRPVVRLVGHARVDLEPGQTRTVEVEVHADLASFTRRDGTRVVEPGDVELRLARHSADTSHTVPLRMTGAVRVVGDGRHLLSTTRVLDPTRGR